MEADLKMASEIQLTMLPQQYPLIGSAPGQGNALRFCHRYQPCAAVGGDFFDLLSMSKTKAGVFGGHMDFGHPDRYWEFRSLGRGSIDFEAILRALNEVGYGGSVRFLKFGKDIFPLNLWAVADEDRLQFAFQPLLLNHLIVQARIVR